MIGVTTSFAVRFAPIAIPLATPSNAAMAKPMTDSYNVTPISRYSATRCNRSIDAWPRANGDGRTGYSRLATYNKSISTQTEATCMAATTYMSRDRRAIETHLDLFEGLAR